MSRIFVHGLGAVSPAGWGVTALREALRRAEPLPTVAMARPGWSKPLFVRPVPTPAERPAFLTHPRLRRSSIITQHTVAASLEALGTDAARVQAGELRLGIVICLMSGCVTYSRRFYEEVLKDPSTASPMLFPETVYNAPGSHLGAYLNSNTVSFTMVGDDTSFLQGVAVATGWLLNGQVDGCLVVGAEEADWLVADAARLFDHRTVPGSGAGAIYLRCAAPTKSVAELVCITDEFPAGGVSPAENGLQRVRAQLSTGGGRELLCLGTHGVGRSDDVEENVWRDWAGGRLAPKKILGEAFTASAAWQCVAACDAIIQDGFDAANVSVLGASRQTIGARFARADKK